MDDDLRKPIPGQLSIEDALAAGPWNADVDAAAKLAERLMSLIDSNTPVQVVVDEYEQIIGDAGTGKTSAETMRQLWNALARRGRKTDVIVKRDPALPFVQVADISQFGGER